MAEVAVNVKAWRHTVHDMFKEPKHLDSAGVSGRWRRMVRIRR